uniref:Uncharacterized protein n=1 Tax=Anabas testudineus TaxID=64144 RepID=A0A3Q1HNK7_ANATE
MKTLCFALVLLLFTVYCSPGLLAIQPDACCFDFSTVKVPPKFVTNITKTHSFCLNKYTCLELSSCRLVKATAPDSVHQTGGKRQTTTHITSHSSLQTILESPINQHAFELWQESGRITDNTRKPWLASGFTPMTF